MARFPAMGILIRLVITAVSLWIATLVIDGIELNADSTANKAGTLLAVAVIFGLVNAIVKPVTKFVTFPLIIVTFGLFLLVINGLMLVLTSRISGWFDLGFTVNGFRAAFLGALVISLVNWLAGMVTGGEKKHSQRD